MADDVNLWHYHVIRIKINRRFERQSKYRPQRTLEVVESETCLSIDQSNELARQKHGVATVAKTTLTILSCNLSKCTMHMKKVSYASLVRPTLDKSSSVRNLSTLEGINSN